MDLVLPFVEWVVFVGRACSSDLKNSADFFVCFFVFLQLCSYTVTNHIIYLHSFTCCIHFTTTVLITDSWKPFILFSPSKITAPKNVCWGRPIEEIDNK